MEPELTDLNETDLEAVKEIYDYYILNSTATFHTTLVTIDELKEIIPVGHPKYRSFMIHYDGNVCGYCYISQHKKRQAYDRTAEITLYLKPEFHGKGIGSYTMNRLEAIARDNSVHVLIGVITGDNLSSIRLFEKCGYEKCGHLKKVGVKFNRVLDVVSYQKILDE